VGSGPDDTRVTPKRVSGSSDTRGGGTRLLMGVDGGNTKTHALVTDADGTVLGTGDAGTADIHNSTPEAGLLEITRACGEALSAAGAEGADLTAAGFSLAGADWPEDFELLRAELRARLGLGDDPVIVNDAVGALRCGTEDSVGVSAVLGTYCAVAGRNAAGDLFHFGFWPDSTGAYMLGSEALKAIWRFMLDLGPTTTLIGRALERWQCADLDELQYEFTRIGGHPPSEPGRFADAVLDEAEAGDEVARGIVVTAGRRLGDYAGVCARRTHQAGTPYPLVLSGGVLRHPSQLLRDTIRERVPEAIAVYPDVEPVVGALLLAADRLGLTLDHDALRTASAAVIGAR
jgi:N-acetylglucosamine kinase-like BadF-type ATPase